ncbi:cell wall-binding repeat-containing protein [Candidatus Poriferisodalis sp.]|uniref:cell wall-binding repeat-containing protein n=1 Tax=Candidatus Poriferisodalis sp. TaxID=3101277 RepID=UPI003C6EFA0C
MRYLEDHAVQRVIVVGGPTAVSDAVLEELAATDSAPMVTRVSGDDRFGTAVAVANELGGMATWCGTNETVVILANGSAELASLALSAGPLAYVLELPILLTRAGELPKATADFLVEHEIDRVLVMGGAAAVSQQVVDDLTELGVGASTRYGGSTADVTSAAIARLMRGTCKDIVGTANNVVVLAHRDALFDAIAAVPVAGEGLDGSAPVPLLMVGDSLPSSTRSYLASTPITIDGHKNHLRVAAIGGPEAVSDAVMAAAVRAGGGARVLSARIRATAGQSGFSVRFGDRIDGMLENLTDEAKDMFYVNDVPASIAVGGVVVPPDDSCDAPKELTVALTHPLLSGDVIEIRPTDKRFGILGDLRPVAAARYTVPTVRTDTRAPTVQVVAPAAHSGLRIIARDNSGPDDISIDLDNIRVVSSRKINVLAESTGATTVDPYLRVAVREAALTAPDGYNTNPGEDSDFDDEGDIAPGDPYPLAEGDTFQLGSGVAFDAEDNRSRPQRTRVASTRASFAISAVRLGPSDPGVDHNPDNAIPDRIEGVSHRVEALLADALRIAAKWTGDAKGAAGNAWFDQHRQRQRL